ncbi:hypothetical protein CFOL_v3_35613 [Cephalotus follicularis]|uniref:Uncharacterized protein n=1 Tax=Cephalotus follicularis TaxID=3775 RepID=A0A1Q3DIH5_CEPFO|nr:hypothetical protein CFOL_v3_35613 [Cephalotus follicularis]
MERLRAYVLEKRGLNRDSVGVADSIFDEESDKVDRIAITYLELAHDKMEYPKANVHDPLCEINLGTEANPIPTYISTLLKTKEKLQLCELLVELRDCFAWSYDEIPGLERRFVENRLPIKEGFRSYKQPPRRMTNEVTLKVRKKMSDSCRLNS